MSYLASGGRVVIGFDTEIPADATWIDCRIEVMPGVKLTVNGVIQNCHLTWYGDPVIDGFGTLAYNYIERVSDD